MRACAFFSPRLDPVLDRRKGHKDAVVSPQVPTRRAVGHAVLDHEPHRQIDHAVGRATARWRQIREVGVAVRATFRTGVLRIGDQEITRTPYVEIPQVVQCPLGLLVTIGRVVTTRTRLSLVGAIMARRFRAQGLVRALLLIPLGVPTIASASAMRYVFGTVGYLNEVLNRLELIALPIDWTGSRWLALVTVAVAETWKVTPLGLFLCRMLPEVSIALPVAVVFVR